ncbi:hypothetical protein N8I74_18645 [Chitiniphilus purpureus]|uniref:Uncharacterized protein n=1 Tax=Chitiniphilus purpureus TaxID=2981137 RepID=A0ABY6DNQ6_9NEIS|nr:hypothetical protein [Chitiniphilus sp. CD1]UXY15308.1 hypothetical protein N8I74_18645 [Chitiniphilus sp. CD1]
MKARLLLLLVAGLLHGNAYPGARLPNLLFIDLAGRQDLAPQLRRYYAADPAGRATAPCAFGAEEGLGGLLYLKKRPPGFSDALAAKVASRDRHAIATARRLLSTFKDDDGTQLDGALIATQAGRHIVLTGLSPSGRIASAQLQGQELQQLPRFGQRVCIALGSILGDFAP